MSELRIIGNETVRKLLDATISGGRISHAQLFSAPEGVGALRIAIDYALKALGAGEEKMFSHPDLHYVFPVNTNKDVKKSPVSDDFLPLWQKFVTEHPYGNLADWYAMMDIENKQGIIGKEEAESIAKKLSLKSFSGGYRAVVIWHGEKMNQQAVKADRGTRRTYIDNNRHGRRRSGTPYHIITMPEGGIPPYRTG